MPPTYMTCAHYYTVGRTEPGLWCESCALPSALRFRYVLMTCGGTVMKRGQILVCHDCGRQWEP